jgi:phosphate-selective porin OprO and OprP
MSITRCFLWQTGFVVSVLLLTRMQPLAAERPSESKRIEDLERTVTELKKEIGELKKQSAPVSEGKMRTKIISEGKRYVEKAALEEKPPVYVQQRGPELKLVLGGFVQVNFEDGDVSAFEGRFGQTAIKDRFRLRRARINLTGDYAEQFDFKMEGDFGQSDGTSGNRTAFSATDIWLNWHQFPAAQVKIGQYKAPFGLEQLTPDTQLLTIERTLPTGAITPDRQIGAELWGKPFTSIWPEQKDLLTYYAGIFNGNGRNITVNDNDEYMSVGRIEVQALKARILNEDASVRFGANGLHSRDASGTVLSPVGNLRVNSDGSLSSFTAPSAVEREGYGFDGSFHWGPFDLIAEYLSESYEGRMVNGVVPTFRDFRAEGYYVQGSYFVIPKKLQLVAKYESFNPGQIVDDNLESITGGVNYFIHDDDIKLMANYIHTWSNFHDSRPALGDADFDEVLLRIQVIF